MSLTAPITRYESYPNPKTIFSSTNVTDTLLYTVPAGKIFEGRVMSTTAASIFTLNGSSQTIPIADYGIENDLTISAGATITTANTNYVMVLGIEYDN
jgi:hypothetical protein|tara:strand:+ start:3090 stop:3383 length:294 start_codon:yes stop_codon:yes gene_type:complete